MPPLGTKLWNVPFHNFVILDLRSCSCHRSFAFYITTITTTSFQLTRYFQLLHFLLSFYPYSLLLYTTHSFRTVIFFAFFDLYFAIFCWLSSDIPSSFRFCIFRVLYMHICLPLSPWSPHFSSPILFLPVHLFLFVIFVCPTAFHIAFIFQQHDAKIYPGTQLSFYVTALK